MTHNCGVDEAQLLVQREEGHLPWRCFPKSNQAQQQQAGTLGYQPS